MNVNTPDCWVILKLTNDGKAHYRVFAGWYGGFAGSDSWKLNSGIVSVKEEDNFYEFTGDSGSVYRCNKECEKMSLYMMYVFLNFEAENTETRKVEIVEYKEMNLD